MNKKIAVLFFFFLGISVLFGTIGALLWQSKPADDDVRYYKKQGGDFTLQSASGPVSLADYRGKVVLIYFGFANCPVTCPAALNNMAIAFKNMGTDANLVQGIFISLDPERDTLEVLDEYDNYFHENIIAITGTPEEVEKVAAAYRVIYEKNFEDQEVEGYSVDHTSFLYAVDGKGRLREIYPSSLTPSMITEVIEQIM